MALFGALATVRVQVGQDAWYSAAFDHAVEAMTPGTAVAEALAQLAVGETRRVELAEGAFSLLQVYHSKFPDEVRWESHRSFIDLQLVVAGAEWIQVCETTGLTLAEDFTPAKDLLLYEPPKGLSTLRLIAGHAALLFPIDAHQASLCQDEPSLVRKVVVKIPVRSA